MTVSVSNHPHLAHLHTIGVLAGLARHPATRAEALNELERYRAETLRRQPVDMSGHCQFESPGSHARCTSSTCTCDCHEEQTRFSGQGIIFAVIDDREELRVGKTTTIDVIADAIDDALEAGHDDPEAIARYLTTSAFNHIGDKRVRFNSILKAGDMVGAQITKKLYSAYRELADLAASEKNVAKRANIEAEARGFAEAITVAITPFSVEDSTDPSLVNWDEVDRLTETFIKEQKFLTGGKKK